jgi:hypothetical protein
MMDYYLPSLKGMPLILKRELVVNSPVLGQEKQDVLKLKNGSL